MNGNTIFVAGRLTRDPELKFTADGRAMCKLGIASGRRYQKDGKWEEETSFFDVTLFRDMAENVAESLSKGDAILVAGRMKQRSYEQDGAKRTAWDLEVDSIGPDLRWSTATVTRTQRSAGNGAAAPSSTI
jgi:single-strand DNA-binding protein